MVQWLNTYAGSKDKVVLADSGLIPYYSNLHFIDSYCLNNVSMTQYPKAVMYERFCRKIINESQKLLF